MANRILHVDPSFTLLMADCAFQAYAVLPPKPPALAPLIVPPSGYSVVGQWNGRNPGYFFDNVEPYGFIFQNDTDKGEYIFSFRGTVTKSDMYEDLFAELALFHTFKNSTPGKVHVATGFRDIYIAAVTPGGTDSMQEQLFGWLDRLKPTKLYITGHSLGSALAELFTLDLYVSLPKRKFAVRHCNFACPRVGVTSFANLYKALEAGEPEENRTVRLVNWYDEIPCLPPYIWEVAEYTHGPAYFLISFYDTANDTYVERHSMYNYWHVLQKVVHNNPQVFSGPVIGIKNAPLLSNAPDVSQTECTLFANESTKTSPEVEPAPKPEELSSRKGCLGYFSLF